MPEYPAGEQVIVEIRGLRSDAPFAVRLRRWLKTGLRSFQLRCLRIRDVPPFPEAAQPQRATPNTAGAVPGGEPAGPGKR